MAPPPSISLAAGHAGHTSPPAPKKTPAPMKSPGNEEYDPPAPSLIPSIGQPKWKRTITTQDVLPSPPPPHATTQSTSSFLRKGRSHKPTRPLGKPSGPLIVEIDSAKEQPSHTKEASVVGPTATFPLCSTCQTNEGRYTCPRCSAPYCSVDCYRIHDVPESARIDDDANETTGGGGRCTESFYQNRVEGITKLEIKGEDNAKTMRNILARSAVNNDNALGAAAAVTDEELLQLAEAMLGIDKAGNDSLLEEGGMVDDAAMALLESLPPHVREAFEASVRDGELSYLINPWRPWWEAELNPMPAGNDEGNDGVTNVPTSSITDIVTCMHSNGGDYNQDTGEDFLPSPPTFGPSNHESEIGSVPTLDDRIVGIKRLHRGKPKATALQYNAIDVVFGVVCTLRLYNGIPKQPSNQSTSNNFGLTEQIESELDAAIGAAETLLCSSLVLGNDARFDSIEEVLTSCSESTVRLSKMDLCNVTWEVLSLDIAAISANGRRGILRALLDGKDIIRGGSKAARLLVSSQATSGGTKEVSAKDEQLGKAQKRYKLAQKKIEFYLSWCLDYWEEISELENLAEAVKGWAEEWGQGEGSDNLSILNAQSARDCAVSIAR